MCVIPLQSNLRWRSGERFHLLALAPFQTFIIKILGFGIGDCRHIQAHVTSCFRELGGGVGHQLQAGSNLRAGTVRNLGSFAGDGQGES
jgi:hypothetical protein